jgi:hypothetical protein
MDDLTMLRDLGAELDAEIPALPTALRRRALGLVAHSPVAHSLVEHTPVAETEPVAEPVSRSLARRRRSWLTQPVRGLVGRRVPNYALVAGVMVIAGGFVLGPAFGWLTGTPSDGSSAEAAQVLHLAAQAARAQGDTPIPGGAFVYIESASGGWDAYSAVAGMPGPDGPVVGTPTAARDGATPSPAAGGLVMGTPTAAPDGATPSPMTGGSGVDTGSAAKPGRSAPAGSATGNEPSVGPKTGDPGRDLAGPVERRSWMSADGRQTSLIQTRRIEVSSGKGHGEWTSIWIYACSTPGEPTVTEGNASTVAGCALPSTYRPDLPTTPDAMLTWLYANSQGQNPPDEQAWVTVGDTLRTAYVPAVAQAAMFDAAARIPGVYVVKNIVDARGRAGIAVARDKHYAGGGWERQQLIFDPTTYAFLGEQEAITMLDQHGGTRTATAYDALIRTAIVPKAGQLP